MWRTSPPPSCARARALPYQRKELTIQAILCDTSTGPRAKCQSGAFVPWVREETENAHGPIEFANL